MLANQKRLKFAAVSLVSLQKLMNCTLFTILLKLCYIIYFAFFKYKHS